MAGGEGGAGAQQHCGSRWATAASSYEPAFTALSRFVNTHQEGQHGSGVAANEELNREADKELNEELNEHRADRKIPPAHVRAPPLQPLVATTQAYSFPSSPDLQQSLCVLSADS